MHIWITFVLVKNVLDELANAYSYLFPNKTRIKRLSIFCLNENECNAKHIY